MTTAKLKLERYIRTENNEKVECVPTSVNLQKEHYDFIREKKIILSKLVRDVIIQLMEQESKELL